MYKNKDGTRIPLTTRGWLSKRGWQFAAPEVLELTPNLDKRSYDGEKADIWSLGMLVFETTFGFLPGTPDYDPKAKTIKNVVTEHMRKTEHMREGGVVTDTLALIYTVSDR